MIGVSTSNVQPAITRLSTETVLQVCVLILVILCATQLTFVKGMFKPNPWLVSPPGSQIADIPIPDETGYAALSPFLHQQGRSIERVLGDGNCLFRSLSHQLTGTQDHHLILRKTITKFEQSYYGMFQQLHNTINRTPFSSHIKNMKKTCIWGTTVEIIATATLFQVDIYIATDSYSQEPTWLKYTPRSTAGAPQNAMIASSLRPFLNHAAGWLEIAPCFKYTL